MRTKHTERVISDASSENMEDVALDMDNHSKGLNASHRIVQLQTVLVVLRHNESSTAVLFDSCAERGTQGHSPRPRE